MPKIIPSPFRVREWMLTILALVLAGAALLDCNASGLGAGGAVFLSLIAGTVLFVVIAGRDRAFFTALFTGAFCAGLCGLSAEDSIGDWLVLLLILFIFCFLIPVALAWLVTFVIRCLKKFSKRDDDAA